MGRRAREVAGHGLTWSQRGLRGLQSTHTVTCSCCSLNMSGRGASRMSAASWAWLSMLTGVVALLHRKRLKISRAL